MQKMMNRKNRCVGCEQCTCGEHDLPYVDKTLQILEESELLLRDILINMLDSLREVFVEAIKEELPDEDCAVMMLLDADGNLSVVTEGEVEVNYPDKEFSEIAVIFEEQLIVAFDPDDVVKLGDMEYLIGPMLIYEMDENGNEVNIDRDTIVSAVDYVDCGFTEIYVDDKIIQAFRLI